MTAVNLCAIQLCSVPNVAENMAAIEQQLKQLDQSATNLVVLPECCLYFGGKDRDQLGVAKNNLKNNEIYQALGQLASRYNAYLIAGSVPAVNTSDDSKFANRSMVFSPQGEKIGHYDKIHLFDVEVEDNEKSYRESATTEQGQAIKSIELPFAHVGLSICYDLRFAELFRALTRNGADIITVPAAFTRVTGEAHWEVLLRARAIENQVYIIAAGQEGVHANGRETWGHSMIISPWGEVLAQLPRGVGMISVPFNTQEISKVRSNIPVAQHNQFISEFNKS